MGSQTLTNDSIKEQEQATKYGALKTFTKGLISKSLSLLQTLFTYTVLGFVFIIVLILNLEVKERLKSFALSLDSTIEEFEEKAFQELKKICSLLVRDFRRVSFYVIAAGLSFCHGGIALFLCVIGIKFCLKYVRDIIKEIPDEEDDMGVKEKEEEDHKEHEESNKDAFLVI